VVDCHFYVRVPVGDLFRYDSVGVASHRGDSALRTDHPPAVGDLVHLYDSAEGGHRGTFRVMARAWLHSSWGSTNWPYGEEKPRTPPMLDLVVVPTEGLFVSEAPGWPEEDEG
jgi:hypothetical protein